MYKTDLRAMERQLNLCARVQHFERDTDVLDPMRVVNRAMYGTDYNPCDVAFKNDAMIRGFLISSASTLL